MKEAIDSAVEFLRSAVQTYPQVSEDEPGGYCSEFDMHLADVLNCVLNMQSRLEQAEKDSARLKIILDAQDADDEECKFAVIKNANYDCYQSSSELIDAIDTAIQSAKESQ